MSNKILIVVDMQNDFIDGTLGGAAAQAIVPFVAERIRVCGKRKERVIFTADTHGADYLSTPEGKALPVVHCVRESDGWRMPEILRAAWQTLPQSSVSWIEKPTFGTLDWKRYISDGDEIEMVGLCTDICVVTNALILKTMFPNSKITVNSALCAGTSAAAHEAALAVMRSCQIRVV